MFEERNLKHAGPTNQTQIPAYKASGSCDRWRAHLLPHKAKNNNKTAGAGSCLRPKGPEFLRWLKKKRGMCGCIVAAANAH